MWSTTSVSRPSPSGTSMTPVSQDETTRHWSFTAFEWVVRDVRKLKDFVEGGELTRSAESDEEGSETDRDDFEVLRESPMLGDGKFKLEIARTLTSSEGSNAAVEPQPPTLSLYLTCLMLDYANADYEISASMLGAIKCQDDRVGERGARADWAWDSWQMEWTFRRENEVWQCPLPSLSSLLENPRINQTDSFVICIQIHSPVGPFFPQHPSAYYVPRDLLEGLEASLDNPNTGDVQFICLERMPQEQWQSQTLSPTPPHTATSESRRSSSSMSHSPSSSSITARKRIVYAHSDILMRRSEYFSTMLSSAFSENASSAERKVYTVVVEEADFITIYWLLKWVYANWLLFTEVDDPRAAVEGVGAGWSARWLNARGIAGEWDWKTFNKAGHPEEPSTGGRDEVRSATSGESVHSAVEGRRNANDKGKMPFQGSSSTATPMRSTPQRTGLTTSSTSKTTSNAPPSRTPTAPRRSGAPGNSTITVSVPTPPQASSSRTQTMPVPIPGSSPHHPLSPRHPRQLSHTSSTASVTDPHVHPTPPPAPASALSVYQIAHRYGMPGLAVLALEHMMSTITPQSCFSLLLATIVWDELHSLVEDYVVEKWDEVSVSEEFERGCEEVAAGEWGAEGGKTLMALFRRLRSPGTLSYVRG
ncbi:hypothetical protein BV25DRAFT_1791142 [Artomyces pyxidatus]|uniref:Uncharacterized protein n=1 Tax=Artomyces pyxidatus TaxID=48021 RepID=A0ACB8TK02_9AGAM|nr:hypothetical protein BV25DRAFT_1791142 [Artomyces pyxidatus]